MKKTKLIATIANVALTVAALVVAALLVQREVVGWGWGTEDAQHRYVEDWQRHLVDGQGIGTLSARVQIVEFVDFQCPFCAEMHRQVRELLREYPEDLRVVYRHLPLRIHAAAFEAALAAECASAQGRFEHFSDLLFAEQYWIGVREWDDFAIEAGVGDSVAFARCMREKEFLNRVIVDMKMARELGVRATPTFLIDGELVTGLSPNELAAKVRQAVEAAQ